MDKLYAPWRDQYVRSQIKEAKAGACVFCTLFDGAESDEQRYILYKDAQIAIVLNLYPYNGGHLMVIPTAHEQNLYDLSADIQNKIIAGCSVSMKILKQALACEAINFGANIGHGSGAGIPDHIHFHIVPRFAGDTGFFTTIGNSKQISVDLQKIYQKLQSHFENIKL